jgi:hypothetical protein
MVQSADYETDLFGDRPGQDDDMPLLPTPSGDDADGTGPLSMVIAGLLGLDRLDPWDDDE